MTEYAMSIKNGDIVFKIKAISLEEAIEHFRKLKQMSKEDFNKLFIVSKTKN